MYRRIMDGAGEAVDCAYNRHYDEFDGQRELMRSLYYYIPAGILLTVLLGAGGYYAIFLAAEVGLDQYPGGVMAVEVFANGIRFALVGITFTYWLIILKAAAKVMNEEVL